MKKSSQDTTLFNKDLDTNKNLTKNKIKTTNVNILLNRVRLDKKKNLRKKVIFFSLIVSVISAFVIFTVI